MPYSIQQLDFPTPVILASIANPISLDADAPQLLDELNALLAGIHQERVYLVADLSGLNLSLKELVLALTSLRRVSSDWSPVMHQRITTLFVETGDLVRRVLDGFETHEPGSTQALVFPTLEAALAQVKQLARAPRSSAGMEGTMVPGVMLRRDAPAPVVVYQLTAEQVFNKRWEQIALDVVTSLASIESDTAYLVIEAPRLDWSIDDMLAILSSTSQPHGNVEVAHLAESRPLTLSINADHLHVALIGLRHGHYEPAYRDMFKVLNLALDQIGQAWMVIRTIRGVFGVQKAGLGQIVQHSN